MRGIALLLLVLPLAHCGYVRGRVTDFEGAIGNKCEYDDDCMTTHAYCKNNRVCSCKNKYEYDTHSDTCFPTQLGLKCMENYDCASMKNAQCIDNICQCNKGYVAPDDGTICLQASRLMASCQEDAQCTPSDPNSHCNRNTQTCDCNINYHPSRLTQTCVLTKRLRDVCDSHESCAGDPDQESKVECKPDNRGSMRCACKPGFNEAGNTCTRDAPGSATTTVISTTALSSVIALYFYFS